MFAGVCFDEIRAQQVFQEIFEGDNDEELEEFRGFLPDYERNHEFTFTPNESEEDNGLEFHA